MTTPQCNTAAIVLPSSRTAEELLQRLSCLNVDRSSGQRKPHKPLLLLCAIQRLVVQGQRAVPYPEVERQLRPLLELYAPPVSSRHSPELPYWHLQSDGVWELPLATSLERSAGGFPRMSALRGSHGCIPARFADALVADPALAARAIQLLLDRHFEPSLHEDLRAAIGLDLNLEADRVAETSLSQSETAAATHSGRPTRARNFRDEVLSAYDYRCAVTGFQALLAGSAFCLEAAHVRWHSQGGPSTVDNGIALTPTLHKLFDHGAWSIDDERRVVVSRHFSGSDGALAELRALHGQPLRKPAPGFPPVAIEHARWHRNPRDGGVFRAPALDSA